MKMSTRTLRRAAIVATCTGVVAAVAAPAALANKTVCQSARKGVSPTGQISGAQPTICMSITGSGAHVSIASVGLVLQANQRFGPFLVQIDGVPESSKRTFTLGTYQSGAVVAGPKQTIYWYSYPPNFTQKAHGSFCGDIWRETSTPTDPVVYTPVSPGLLCVES